MNLKAFFIVICILLSNVTCATEATTAPVNITEIDTNIDIIYFTVAGGTMCNTTVFTLDMTRPRGKEMFSALLTAAAAGKKVRLATWGICKSGDPSNTTGNWGTEVQGIFVQF